METKCAECDAGIAVPDDAIRGELVTCKDCGSDYEVVEIQGGTVLLKPADAIEEDWGE